jgi:hypothetical protein
MRWVTNFWYDSSASGMERVAESLLARSDQRSTSDFHARQSSNKFELPKIVTASDARAASTALFAALSRGEISPSEATQVMGLLTSHVRLVDSADLEPRVTALEEERRK